MAELSLQDALRQFLKQSRLNKGIQAVQIEEVWEEIVGKTIAKYTDSIQIHGSTRFYFLTGRPLKNELIFQKQAIIRRVNGVLGEKSDHGCGGESKGIRIY
ncbi:MAG: DciA family protein [Ferruginibacter sp.]